MTERAFVTAINCMDGRMQLPVIEWMKATYDADYVDMITEPGPDRILSETGHPLTESIRRRVLISVERHGSKVIAVVAHDDCAGNPVSKEEHLEMLRGAVRTVESWELGARIVGLWVGGERWQVEEA